jgi:hypothetical protein
MLCVAAVLATTPAGQEQSNMYKRSNSLPPLRPVITPGARQWRVDTGGKRNVASTV